ncbi:PRA1 FAMILY PROTEIN [Salix koriyanagi]|uniref:PRA1 family protein n=1 Tax=Salix koriyanagi TaxID=2511006 RepID=A0A9Q0PMC1_9ROSI|nr:PRA1 FAMILY PROTEIN [Salix koriyanagi]
MSSHGTIQRPSTVAAPTTPTGCPEDSTGKKLDDFRRPEFRLVCPLSIPSSPEAASLRIIQNLAHFALYYTHFVWIVLFITLIPQRKVSLILLVIMTYVASLYLLLLRACPANFHLLRKIIDKRIVLGLIVMATMIELIATKAGLHLVITLAATVPLVLTHAVFWARNDFCVEKRGAGGGGGGGGCEESVPLVDESPEIV